MKRIPVLLLVVFATVGFHLNTWAKKDPLKLNAAEKLTGTVNFDSVTVIDLRINKEGLPGYYLDAIDITEDKFPATIEDLGKQVIDSAAEKKNSQLVILLHNLQYTAKIPGILAVGTFYLKIDTYLKTGNTYQQAGSIDKLYEFPALRGKDELKLINMMLSHLFTGTIADAAKLTAEGRQYATLEEIITEHKNKTSNIPVFNTAPRRGIYYTVKQFLDNTPADTNFIHERICYDGICQSRFYLPKEIGKKKKGKNLGDSTCFAIYDNERNKWYHPVSKYDSKEIKFENGNCYYLEIDKGLYVEDYSSLAGGGFMFGALGALAYAGTAAIMQDIQSKKPAKFKEAFYKLRLDPATGEGIKVERLE